MAPLQEFCWLTLLTSIVRHQVMAWLVVSNPAAMKVAISPLACASSMGLPVAGSMADRMWAAAHEEHTVQHITGVYVVVYEAPDHQGISTDQAHGQHMLQTQPHSGETAGCQGYCQGTA